MAENIILNDHPYLPLMEDPNAAEKVLLTPAEVESLNQDMLIDAIMSETSELHNPEPEHKENNVSNEENHVESPTTGDAYVFKCAFCDQILSSGDEPKLLECLHNACSGCINSKIYDQYDGVNKNEIQCPLCSSRCDTSRIIENQFLLETASSDDQNTSKNTELKCSSCSDDAVATSYCTDCSEFICDNCVQAHQRLKITKDHTIKPKEDGMSELNTVSNGSPANMFCMTHPHEKLSLFCESCDKLTCRDCQLQEHREHKYKFTTEIASEARKYIAEMLKDVGYKRVLLTSAMKVIDDRQNLITDKKQALVTEITQLVVKLTNTINVRGKQLVAKLTEVCDSKQKTLQEKKEALEQLSKMTDHCIEFTQHALDKGSDMALLYSKKQVTEHLKRIKCKRADIPNPEIPVRIHLALDKVPDLIKVMSTIGQIVVDGRIYPSQAISPSNSIQPHASTSPGVSRPPPQSPSPISPLHQQNSPSNFQQHRLPGPTPFGGNYQSNPQFQQQGHNMQNMNQNMNQNHHSTGPNMHNMGHNQNMSHSLGQAQNMGQGPQNIGQGQNMCQGSQNMAQGPQNMGQGPQNMGQGPQNMGPGMNHNMNQNLGQQILGPRFPPQMQHGPPPGIPMSLSQQLSMNTMNRIQRPLQQRAIMPRMPNQFNHQQQQQVSSSTHPHGMMQDRSNLRHLLQPNTGSANNPVYVRTGPDQYQAVQPHLAQQFQNRFQTTQQFRPQQTQMRMILNSQNRMPIQKPGFQQQGAPSGQQGLKWHTPQQNNAMMGNNANKNTTLPTINDNFKITLRQQNHQDAKNLPATVTSTNPKTPSPNHVKGRTDTERNLDKFCEDSVNDLMATIAKLDSNGVQVLAEGRQKGGSPHVDSSTGDAGTGVANKIKSEVADTGKDDPNEDWCAVCMDGGELVCCDKCPKVFHQYCHIPNLSVEENDTWQCLLCMNFADIPQAILGEKKDGELSVKERKIAERIVLEMYCQYDISLPFREVIGPDNVDYHSIIKNPIALDTIRQKLNWSADDHYRNMENLVKDVRRMFKNAYTFNAPDTQVYNEAKMLEKFFDEQLEKFLPEYAYETFEDDDDESQPPNKKYRRIVSD